MRPLVRVSLLALLTSAALTSCATTPQGRDVASVDGPGSSAPAPAADFEKFQKCMKDQGVEDRTVRSGGGGVHNVDIPPMSAAEQRKHQEAAEKCKQFAPDGGEPVAASPEEFAKLVEMTKCLRAEGVAVEDPKPGESTFSIPKEIDRDPKTKVALDKCDAKVWGAPVTGGNP